MSCSNVKQLPNERNTEEMSHARKKLNPYCTCVSTKQTYPYYDPRVNCNITKSLIDCINQNKLSAVWEAPCRNKDLSFRQKRSIHTGNFIQTVIHQDDDAPEMFLMDVTKGEEITPDFNWKNGWTEQKAKDFCIHNFQTSASESVCSEYVPSVPSEKYIRECIQDIRLAGNTDWLDVSIGNYGSACLQEASKMENLTMTNSSSDGQNELNIFEVISALTCMKNCSGNGICVEGVCNCADGYVGSACDRTVNEQPEIFITTFDGLCDLDKRPCQKFIIPGLHFADVKLTCKFRHFKIHQNETIASGLTEFSNGEFRSIFSMMCPAPVSRRKRSSTRDKSAVGYFLSVSNDGKNFTEELTLMIYDSKCFECNTTSLSCEKVPTCTIGTPVKIEKDERQIDTYIEAGVGGAAAVILAVMVFVVMKNKCFKTKKKVEITAVFKRSRVKKTGN